MNFFSGRGGSRTRVLLRITTTNVSQVYSVFLNGQNIQLVLLYRQLLTNR